MKNKRLIGFGLVIFGAFSWGIGGTVAQQLFQKHGIEVSWLVSTRLLIGGIGLLLIQMIFKDKNQILNVWRKYPIKLLIFGLVGMLAVQYTYMASIEKGNAAVATLLQYLAPVMIIIWLVLRRQSKFTQKDAITVTLALFGSFLLLTNGSLNTLSVSVPAIVWGLLSGVTLAFYTLYAIPLLKEFDSLVIVGWAMLIGSFFISFVHPPWRIDLQQFTTEVWINLFVVIIFGTMLAFWFYIESLQTLTAKETSLLGNIEPLTAVLATVFWLNVSFGIYQWIGTGFIILMMVYLAFAKEKKPA